MSSEFQRPAGRIGFPERHLARFTRSGGDEDAIVGDLFDPPCRCTEQERFADAALEHHFFIELADTRVWATLANEEYAVESAVWNIAAVDYRDRLCSFQALPPL